MIKKLENIDCMIGMKQYPDKFFDLAIVDVPYGIGFDGYKTNSKSNPKWKNVKSKEYTKKEWDFVPEIEYFNELFRVSKNQIIFGANHFISKIPFDSSCWIVWDKMTNGNFADCELAWTSFNCSVKKFKWLWNGFQKQKPEIRIHPTQKPVELYNWILQNFAKQSDIILDTHLGSFSSIISFEKFGCQYVGYEIDKEYFDNGTKRVSEFKEQLSLSLHYA